MRRERGLAAVTALLIVAVAASAAALMLSQQAAMLDQTAMVAHRAQADAYAQAGFDWARGVLAQDGRDVDHLGEGWAQPMAGLPVERAVVSGFIVDEQGKFNLNNLAPNGNASEADLRVFRQLLETLGLARELADAVVDWIDRDPGITMPGGAEDNYYLALPRPYRAANQPMQQVEELYRVRGFDAKTVARLRPFVTAIPATARTKVNVNTAPQQLLAALLPEVPPPQIESLVATRRKTPLVSEAMILDAIRPKGDAGLVSTFLDVKSGWFLVGVQVAQEDVHVAGDALIERRANGATVMIWRRPRS
jgi:general secretion pathway protein K